MTDQQQPPAPERIWAQRYGGNIVDCATHKIGENDIEYARVHPVNDARVEEIERRLRIIDNHPPEEPELAQLLSDAGYLLSRLKDGGAESLENLVSEIVDAVSHCGPLRKVVREETTYIFGFDVTKVMTAVTRILTRATVPTESSERCAECGHNNVNRNNGLCVERVDRKQQRCGHQCVFPASTETDPATPVAQPEEACAREIADIYGLDDHQRQPLAAIISRHFPAAEQSKADLDPLEFWQDLAEALGHPRPEKADVPALVSEAAEMRNEFERLKGEVERLDGELSYANGTCKILNENVIRVTGERDTARADAIREAVAVVKRCRPKVLGEIPESDATAWVAARSYLEAAHGSLLAALEQLRGESVAAENKSRELNKSA